MTETATITDPQSATSRYWQLVDAWTDNLTDKLTALTDQSAVPLFVPITVTFKPMSIREIASKRAATGGPIVAAAGVNPAAVAPGFATQFCDIEVDPDTGKVTILRYVAAQDVGRAIHPSYVEGQIQGGVVQGIGWALNEEYIYDSKGRLENPGFLDYRIPVASDLPMIEPVMVEVPNPGHPYGAKGVAEVNICPPMAAIANAIERAVGRRLTDLPMSPPKVLAAIDARE